LPGSIRQPSDRACARVRLSRLPPGISDTGIDHGRAKGIPAARPVVVAGKLDFGDFSFNKSNLRIAVPARRDAHPTSHGREHPKRRSRQNQTCVATLSRATETPHLPFRPAIRRRIRKAGAHPELGFAQANHLRSCGRYGRIFTDDGFDIVGDHTRGEHCGGKYREGKHPPSRTHHRPKASKILPATFLPSTEVTRKEERSTFPPVFAAAICAHPYCRCFSG
jgi:hypothetical protein